MKNYIIGFLSCALIIVCLFTFVVPVMADTVPFPIDLSPNTYVWTEEEPDYSQYDTAQIVTGGITVGYLDPAHTIPIVKQGVMITFNTPPTPEDLDSLDLELNTKGLVRTGGATVKTTLLDQQEQIVAINAALSEDTNTTKNPLRELIEKWRNK